ncbi:MAG: aminotransferase class V-fold PLP-dependent enzyme [Acidobacteriota bacterium]|nr:aminotransferase class V-fold PLP-dependent enzyme [Acidobacteriota bacterium]
MARDNDPGSQSKRALLAELLLAKQRKSFPLYNDTVYLNVGAQGIMPEPARQAVAAYFETQAAHPPFSLELAACAFEQFQGLRALLALELNVPENRIALMENTTHACAAVLWGLPWNPGDHLLLSANEYPGILTVVDVLKKRFQLQVTSFPTDVTDEELLARFQAELRPDTRLVLASHVTWDTGRLLPIETMATLCKAKSADCRFLVDAAQSAGALALDLGHSAVDFFAFPGHKWFCGPEGTGALVLSESARDMLQPALAGWRALDLVKNRVAGLYRDSRGLEGGTASPALAAGWRAAVESHRKWGGPEQRAGRVNYLAGTLWAGLANARFQDHPVQLLQKEAPGAGLVTFRVLDMAADKVVAFFQERGVHIRQIPDSETLRACPHYLNTDKDMETFLGFFQTDRRVKSPP